MNKKYEDLLLKEVKELLKKLPPNVRIRVYYGSKGRRKRPMDGRETKHRVTLAQIAKDLAMLNQKVDGVIIDIKDINVRLDNVEKRLDYNNLKQLPRDK